MRRICGCRYCWIDGETRACGSVKVGKSAGFVINRFFKCFIISGGSNSPLRRPLRAPCHMHWELRKIWYKSHPQNNGSTSFSLTSGHRRQTFCSPQKVRTKSDLVPSPRYDSVLVSFQAPPSLLTWSATLYRRTVLQWYQLFWLVIAVHPAQWEDSLACRFCPFHWGSWWW